jgi:hypothetical protein
VPLNAIRQPWNACQCSQKLLLLSLFSSSTSLLLSLVFSTRILQLLSCSLNKTVVSPAPLLFSQQDCCFSSSSLVLSTKLLFLLKTVVSSSSLGISPKSLLASHQDFFNFLFLASHQEPLGISPRVSFLLLPSLASQQEPLALSTFFHFLASHQEPLGISPRVSCSLNKIASTSCSLNKNSWISPLVLSTRMLQLLLFSQQECLTLALGISPRASWPLTKISSASLFLASHQDLLASHQESLFLPKNGCAHLP